MEEAVMIMINCTLNPGKESGRADAIRRFMVSQKQAIVRIVQGQLSSHEPGRSVVLCSMFIPGRDAQMCWGMPEILFSVDEGVNPYLSVAADRIRDSLLRLDGASGIHFLVHRRSMSGGDVSCHRPQ